MRRSVARLGLGLLCGLALILTAGCANISLFSTRQPVSGSAPPTTRDEGRVSSKSDRLRGDHDYKLAQSADAPQPASLQELQPQSLRPDSQQPSEAMTPGTTAEPDPRAVIDWLLKERR